MDIPQETECIMYINTILNENISVEFFFGINSLFDINSDPGSDRVSHTDLLLECGCHGHRRAPALFFGLPTSNSY